MPWREEGDTQEGHVGSSNEHRKAAAKTRYDSCSVDKLCEPEPDPSGAPREEKQPQISVREFFFLNLGYFIIIFSKVINCVTFFENIVSFS